MQPGVDKVIRYLKGADEKDGDKLFSGGRGEQGVKVLNQKRVDLD